MISIDRQHEWWRKRQEFRTDAMIAGCIGFACALIVAGLSWVLL